MRTIAVLLGSALFLLPAPLAAQPPPGAVQGQEVVAAIQVHGNTLTASEDIIRASGLAIGDPVSETALADAEARLRSAIKFESVDVLKRFASISDPTRILILIQVDEGPVRIDVPDVDEPGATVPGVPAGRPTAVRRGPFKDSGAPPRISAE